MRIDAVHFCPLEEYYSEQRRKKHIDPASIVPARLRLFQRTAWARPDIASSVLFFKLPYMTRETHKADLARTISALPNLRYIDLPDAFYNADPSTTILRDELQATCWDLRKMKYAVGAEQVFEAHAHQQFWSSLEIVELDELAVDLMVLRYVLASLPALNELTLRALPRLDDTAFQSTPNLPNFPPLQTLKLQSSPGITSQGLSAYVSRADVSEVLSSLSLAGTSVTIPTLHTFLTQATHLTHFSVTEDVSRNFPLEPIPPLASRSLHTFNFEIASSSNDNARSGLISPAHSYYNYLATSLHANRLPSLRKLYVRYSQFPELLLTPPQARGPRMSMAPPSMNAPGPPSSFSKPRQNHGTFNQPLEIFAKGVDDLEWAFTSLSVSASSPPGSSSGGLGPNSGGQQSLAPPSAPFGVSSGGRPGSSHGAPRSGSTGSTASMGRPVSAYYASQGKLGPQWDGEARKSVMMGNGQGGFLAAPPGDPAVMYPEEEFPMPSRPFAEGSNSRPGSRRGSASGGFPGAGSFGGDGAVLGHKSKPSRGLWR